MPPTLARTRYRHATALTALLLYSSLAGAQEPPPADASDVSAPPAQISDEQPESNPCRTAKGEEEFNAWLDRLHKNLFRFTCSSATWFDGLFGNRRYDEEYRATHGSVLVGVRWDERDRFDQLFRFKVRLYLPQLNESLHAFIGRSDREDFIAESQSDLYMLPEQFNRRDDDVFVGFGYKEPMRKRGSFDADVGVRLRFPMDPYVKGSYRFVRPIGERDLLRLRETVFWQKSERLGTTGLIEWDRILAQDYLLRWTNSGTFSQNTEGVRWYSTLTLYQLLSDERAFAYELGANGSTDREVPLTDYGAAVIYRQRIWRDWLLIELRAGVDWPREELAEERRANLNAGLAFEMRYGNRR